MNRKPWSASNGAALLLLAILVFLFQGAAQAAITYVGSASNPADGNSLDSTTVAVAPPGSMQVGDLVILVSNTRESGMAMAISATGGQTWTAQTANTTTVSQAIFWARYNGTWSANPSVSFPSNANGTTVVMHVFRPTSSANTWALDVAQTNASFSSPSNPYNVQVNGITTQTNGALVFATWASSDNNVWGLQTAGWTNAGGTQYRNRDGSDCSQSAAYMIMATAGGSGNVINRQTSRGGDAGNSSILAFKEVPPVTTLATGTDPAVVTIAPESAAADVNQFTLQTSIGTEAVASVTVNLSSASGIGRLAITNSGNTELGFTTSPVTGSNTISVSGLSAGTTLATFKVRVTPLSHANMPGVPGGAYTITAPVTAWVGGGTHTHAGSDTNANALTIDNLSPSNATAPVGTVSSGQVALSWTNPADADLNSIVVLRGTAAVTDTLTEGTTYTAGTIVGSSTVACVVTAPTASCTDTGRTNGTAYYYKVVTKDNNGNYASGGLAGGPFTPLFPAVTVSQAFSPASVAANATSTLTITITNPNATAVTGLAFSHTYPANLTNFATPTTTCGGTVTGAVGSGTLSLSGGTANASGSCTITATVKPSTAGSYVSPAITVSSANASSGTSATATLTAIPVSAANSTVVASPTSIPADNSTTSTITVTLKDGGGNGVAGKTVTLAKSGGNSVISAASGVSNAAGVVTFTVKNATVEGPITYTATDTTDSVVVTQTTQVTFTTPVAQDCTSNASGNWDVPATWTNCRGGIPLLNDHATILPAHTVTLNVTPPKLGNVTNGGTLNASGTQTLSVGGNFANNGTLSLGSSSVDLYGDFSNTTGASFNTGATDTGTWTFRGTAVQNINSTGILTTFPSLTLNNTFGIALNASSMIKNQLTLTNGYISTGTNILTLLSSCATPSWTRTNGFVAGNLRLTFPSAVSPGATCTYPIGSGTNYAPLGLTMVSTGGTLTGSTTGYEHPSISASSIDPTLDANRYWTLGATGDSITASSYGATFNFQTGDLDVNAYPAAFIVSKYASGAWSLPTTTTGTNSASIANIAGPITIPTDFAIGQIPEPCTVPAGLPANMTCVCDNFGRTNLNPSTIYGADWLVDNKNQASTFGNPRIVNYGKLRLTDNSGGVATVANVPSTFPAAGNLIVVEFKHYAYNGSGADGIAFTLSDATKTPTPGAFGGSLGYAPKSNPGSDCTTAGGCPGFNGGWVGVAIDEFGNFSSNTEGRTGGTAPGQRADSVAVRGSGSGQTGYPYMAGSATLSPEIDNAASTSASRGYLYKFTVDARCYQSNTTGCTNPSLAKMTEVKVERDTGTGYTTVVPAFDAFAVNASQADVPANWKLSLTGSTGGGTNIHEVSGLKVCAQTITPPAGYRIQVDNLLPSSCTTAANGKPIVTITALDNAGNTLTSYANPVTLMTRIGSPNGALSTTTTWTPDAGNKGTWDSANKRYTFHANDLGVAKFQLTDSATENIYITVSEYLTGSTLTTTLATPVQFSGGAFSVSVPDSLSSEVVAGRPHLLRITRTNGCGTDASYAGAKALDSWYTPTTADHPGIAVAPQLCATNASGTCQPAGGSCQVQSIAPPALSSASNNLTLSFTGGIANFCLVTSDVGKYSINVRDDSNVAAPIAGSTTTLTARPLALYFNSAAQAAITNPMTATPNSGTVFISAGDTFKGTVSALLWNSTLDPGYTGTPTVTPQTNWAAWNALLANTTPSFAWPTTLAIAGSGSPSSGTLGGASTSLASAAYSNGSAVLPDDSLWIDNVGSFLLTETVSNYLNTSGMTVPAYSDYVGRFYVDHFAVVSGSVVTAACNGFTYMGQPNLGIQYTITAQNKKNATTTNYAGSPTVTLVAEDEGTGNAGYDLGSRLSVPGTPVWSAGVYTVNSSVATFSRPSTLGLITGTIAEAAGPFDLLKIGVKVSGDPDSAPLQSMDMNAAASGDCATAANCDAKTIGSAQKVRLGRLRLFNAFGTEKANLEMTVQAQYWTGKSWIVNSLDTCTSLPANAFNLIAPPSGTGVSGPVSITNGQGILTLTKPNPTTTASVDLALNLGATGSGSDTSCLASHGGTPANLSWLRGIYPTGSACPGTNIDPSARATFGLYSNPEKRKAIHIRETY